MTWDCEVRGSTLGDASEKETHSAGQTQLHTVTSSLGCRQKKTRGVAPSKQGADWIGTHMQDGALDWFSTLGLVQQVQRDLGPLQPPQMSTPP